MLAVAGYNTSEVKFNMASYAVIQTGGKQYRVQPGDTIRVEYLPGDEGDTIDLNDVLMLSEDGNVTLGAPTIPGAKVTTEVTRKGKAKKVIVFKYKAKTRYRRKNGHRQLFTDLKVIDISTAKEPTSGPTNGRKTDGS